MATVNRADTAVNLDQGGAWVNGVAPTSADIATWGNPAITVNLTRNLGASVSWGGIEFLSTQTSAITIGTNAFTLTVGASGINLSASGANLSLTSSTIISLAANQTWNVGSGRTLSLTSVVSSTATNRILTKEGVGTLTLNATNNFGGSGGGLVVNAGLVTGNNNNSFGNASNTVTVASGAAIQVSAAAPVQTAWSVSGAGTATSYGALWVSGSTTFGNSTRVVTAQASNTVLSFRTAAAFAGTIALGAGVTSIILNGENTGTADTNVWTMPTQSDYGGAGTTVTLKSVGLDGVTARGVKYSIGSAANVTDAVSSGGGGLGKSANAIVIDATGGLHTNSTTTPAFNRSYTFNARGGRLSYGQFKYAALGTVSFNGTLTLSGGTGDYVQLHGNNDPASIIKLNGTITGGANLDIGSNGSNSTVDGTLEIGSSLDSSGWASTAALSVNHIRYGKALANDNAITFGQVATSFIDAVASGVVARHSSYTNTNASAFSFTGTNDLTMTGPVAGSANWTGTTGTWTVTANVLTIGFNFVTSGGLTKAGAGTLALSGNNTGLTGLAWNAGNLRLNSSGSAGTGASASVTIASASGILDNTSGGAVSLNQSGTIALNANFTWTGSADLTFGVGNVTTSATRTITFGSGGGTGTLKLSGAATTTTATSNWNIGGSTPGARQRVTLVGANGWAPTSTNASVTAGYFQIQNSNGLGAAVNTTTWYVGMTTAGVATTGAALELSGGITVPSNKTISIRGNGPNTDGALRSVSGTNSVLGTVSVPLVAGARIQADAGTFTLDATTTTIAPANASTPLSFAALSGATLNQNRQLTSSVGTVAVNDTVGATGTVVFAAANSNTGLMTTSAGTAKFTHANGPGNGGNTFPANTTAMVATSNYKATFVGTTTFGTNGSAAKARLQIGT